MPTLGSGVWTYKKTHTVCQSVGKGAVFLSMKCYWTGRQPSSQHVILRNGWKLWPWKPRFRSPLLQEITFSTTHRLYYPPQTPTSFLVDSLSLCTKSKRAQNCVECTVVWGQEGALVGIRHRYPFCEYLVSCECSGFCTIKEMDPPRTFLFLAGGPYTIEWKSFLLMFAVHIKITPGTPLM